MKLALNIGPVITSIMASSPIFRSYAGGVIDSHSMCETVEDGTTQTKIMSKPNHAVLVVGYGKARNPFNDIT